MLNDNNSNSATEINQALNNLIPSTNNNSFKNQQIEAIQQIASQAIQAIMGLSAITKHTTGKFEPKIYAYSTPNDHTHDGCLKVGYTEKDDVEERVKEQTHTSGTAYIIEFTESAIKSDGKPFTDKELHAYLLKSGIKKMDNQKNEWFRLSVDRLRELYKDFINYKEAKSKAQLYTLRKEQQRAVDMTYRYYEQFVLSQPEDKQYKLASEAPKFLWNAKPRFGKTLTSYDFCKRIGATKILIITNRPAISNSWYSDYMKFSW